MVADILAYKYERLHGAKYNCRIEYTLVYTNPLNIGNLLIRQLLNNLFLKTRINKISLL